MTFVIVACVLSVCIDATSGLNDCNAGSDACPQPSEILEQNIPVGEDDLVLLQGKTHVSSEVGFDLKLVEPPPITVIDENDDDNLGSSSVCGAGEEVIPTTCLGNSVVKEQARAVAHMSLGRS